MPMPTPLPSLLPSPSPLHLPARTLPVDGRAPEHRFVTAYLSHARDTATLLDAWLKASPLDPRPHAVKAFLLVMLGRAELRAGALASAQQAIMLAASGAFTDRILADAALAAAEGAWASAVQALETVSRLEPDAALFIKLGHSLRFMLGDKAGLLASVEAALDRLCPSHAQRGFVLGMQAFALEETGHYRRAERIGREAVALRPDDAWGIHAVSHAQEMTGQVDAGIDWIESHEAGLRACNNFSGHVFWHLALFRLERGEIDAVLALYDREIRQDKTDDFRDIANAASLLARLESEGHSVGDRWEELADKAEARLEDRAYVFADLHYMLALIGAGRQEAAHRLAQSFRTAPAAYAAQHSVANGIGAAVAEGLRLARSEPQAAFHSLMRVRPMMSAIGGSDAQRDVFEQALLDCAIRAGESRVAQQILRQRLSGRGGANRFAVRRLDKLGTQNAQRPAALALVASLAFARPAEHGHQH